MNDIKIIFENDDLIVVDKPSGMPTHPSRLHQGDSLADAVGAYLCNKNFVFRAINRLDRETSGLVLIAKTKESAARLNALMRDNKIHREYMAEIADDGSLPDHGTIDAPIARLNKNNPHDIRRAVDYNDGERAVTHYTVLERYDGSARILCTLETGRTHQIRVHMAYIGHPIIGDSIYNPDSNPGDTAHLRAVRLTVDDNPEMVFQTFPVS